MKEIKTFATKSIAISKQHFMFAEITKQATKKNEPNVYRVFLGYFGTRRFRMSASIATIPVIVSVTLFGLCIINSYRSEDKTQRNKNTKTCYFISGMTGFHRYCCFRSLHLFSTLLLHLVCHSLTFKCSFSLIYPPHIFS